MNLVFIGSSNFGLRCLETSLQLPGVQVVGVVTAPQTFTISYRPTGVTNVLHADISALACEHNIPVKTLERSMNEPGLFEAVAEWRPDAFLVAGWYHMIPRRWRNLAPAYGLHASLLPDYSGGAPLVWAMINGETRTGITLFQMDDGVDSGPVAGQKEEPIFSNDTIATLYSRIEARGIELLGDVFPQLAAGTLQLQAQDESKRRIVPQRGPEDGQIDWSKDAVYIDRFIRAQTRPYPGAFTTLDGKPLHIWYASAISFPSDSIQAGHVQRFGSDTYLIGCGTGAIQLHEICFENKNFASNQLISIFGFGGQQLGLMENES